MDLATTLGLGAGALIGAFVSLGSLVSLVGDSLTVSFGMSRAEGFASFASGFTSALGSTFGSTLASDLPSLRAATLASGLGAPAVALA